MVNPIKSIYDYYEKSGVRRDLPVMKRMMVEIPYMPIGGAVAVASMVTAYVYLNYFFDTGLGYENKYTVLRSDDPRLLKYRDDVINADKNTQQ